jgi:hypothetical protein
MVAQAEACATGKILNRNAVALKPRAAYDARAIFSAAKN